MRRVVVWVYEGCLASAFAGPIDVLLLANAVWARVNRENKRVKPLFEWRVESLDGRTVRAASGRTIDVDGAIGSGVRADAVILPALFVPDVDHLRLSLERLQALSPALRKEHAGGAVIGASCTGSFLLAAAGLLDRRPATVHWGFARMFEEMYPDVDLRPQEMLTEKDDILCAAGTAYMKLGLRLVEKFAGEGVATATAEMLLIDANRAPHVGRRSTTLQDLLGHTDPLVSRAQRWMMERLGDSFQLASLAADLGVSERTVSRRFNRALGKTPITYLQTLRIEAGKRFLETTRMSVESVAELVGYGDVNFFRRVFKRQTGLSPRQYHHKYIRRHVPTTCA
jgi:transcriptional regulator GlxA family with amidase domain